MRTAYLPRVTRGVDCDLSFAEVGPTLGPLVFEPCHPNCDLRDCPLLREALRVMREDCLAQAS